MADRPACMLAALEYLSHRGVLLLHDYANRGKPPSKAEPRGSSFWRSEPIRLGHIRETVKPYYRHVAQNQTLASFLPLREGQRASTNDSERALHFIMR